MTASSEAARLARLIVAQRCRPGDRVVDVCCGDAALLDSLAADGPRIHAYTGLDQDAETLRQVAHRHWERGVTRWNMAVTTQSADVSTAWPEHIRGPFDVAVLAWALEDMTPAAGRETLRRTVAALRHGGRLMVATTIRPDQDAQGTGPGTSGTGTSRTGASGTGTSRTGASGTGAVRPWSRAEVEDAVGASGAVIDPDGVIGLLPGGSVSTETLLDTQFGAGAVEFHRAMRRRCPVQSLDPVVATGLDLMAGAVLVVSTKRDLL